MGHSWGRFKAGNPRRQQERIEDDMIICPKELTIVVETEAVTTTETKLMMLLQNDRYWYPPHQSVATLGNINNNLPPLPVPMRKVTTCQ